jgi:hypothetical protein
MDIAGAYPRGTFQVLLSGVASWPYSHSFYKAGKVCPGQTPGTNTLDYYKNSKIYNNVGAERLASVFTFLSEIYKVSK